VGAATAAAQTGTGSLAGRVLYPDGSPVLNAPIQLKSKTTGAVARAVSASDGSYELRYIAPGEYDLTISMPCCAYGRVAKEVAVEANKPGRLDVSLIETVNGSTLGDDPARLADVMRKRAKVQVRWAPRTPAGTPDLSGVWLLTDDPYPEEPALLPSAAARAELVDKNPKMVPHNRCLPGPPAAPGSASPFIAKVVQTPSLMVILFEDYPGFRQVFLDGRAHPNVWQPSWMGHSVGHWERDILVVDTIGFNDESLLGGIGGRGISHTEALRMTERYRRIDFGHMELKVTFDDPGAFARPYHENLSMTLAPEELLEYVCENNKPEHLVGK
jgi:Carboxypeptidase regulatory-like domain